MSKEEKEPYERYGVEWIDHVGKWKKIDIILQYRAALIREQATKDALHRCMRDNDDGAGLQGTTT